MTSVRKLKNDELISLVLSSFRAEKLGEIKANEDLLDPNFAVTDMVLGSKDNNLPRLSGAKLKSLINESFKIKGRQFDFKTVIADVDRQTVMVEFVESYPDPKTSKQYRTPQVAVCEVKEGKIYRTRHYMDPRLSFEYLSESELEKAFE